MFRRESAALGRRIPWVNRLFSKSMKGKILNFLHAIKKMISVMIEKIGFPFFKQDRPNFQEIKVNFSFKVYYY